MGRRCFGDGDPLYEAYHDDEWGRPVADERGIFERLCLEGFQSGLSWLIVLRKRETIRRAFADFQPEAVAAFGARDVRRLLADPGVIRNRAKIEATIANARGALALRDEGRDLAGLFWSYADGLRTRAARSFLEVPPATPGSTALAKELRRRGFRFVGPTTVYASMQACGLVNDHLAACPVRSEVSAARTAAIRGLRAGRLGRSQG